VVPGDVVVFVASELGFLGVLIGLMIVAAFGFLDKIAAYRIEARELGKCIEEMSRFFRVKSDPEPETIPKSLEAGADEEVGFTMNLLKSVVYLTSAEAVALIYVMGIILQGTEVTTEVIYFFIIPSSAAVVLIIALVTVLIREVLNISLRAAKVHSNLMKLRSGSVKLERKDGTVIDYRPGELFTSDTIYDPSTWGM